MFSDTSQIVTKANDDLVALIKSRIADHKAAEAAKEELLRTKIAAEEKVKAEAAARAETARQAAEAQQVIDEAARLQREAAQAEAQRLTDAADELAMLQLAAMPEHGHVDDAASDQEQTRLQQAADQRLADAQPAHGIDDLWRAAEKPSITSVPAHEVDGVKVPAYEYREIVPVGPPTLTLGKIGTRLGFSLSADFLRSIGFEPAGRERSAVLFHESDWSAICSALITHVGTAGGLQALPGGQRYSKTTFKENGKPILLNEDGTRNVFCDVDD